MYKHVFILLFIALAMIKLARSTEDGSEEKYGSEIFSKEEFLAEGKTDFKSKNFSDRDETKPDAENNSGKKRKFADTISEEKTNVKDKSNYIKHRLSWTDAEDKLLKKAVASCDGDIDFKKIYDYFQEHNNFDRTEKSIRQRYHTFYQDKSNYINYSKNNLRWTDAEDKLLKEAVASCDGDLDFKKIYDYFRARNIFSNHSERAIKEHYYHLYSSDQKNPYFWTEEDKELLVKAREEKDKNWKKATEYYNDNKKDSQQHRTELSLISKFHELYPPKYNHTTYHLRWTDAEYKLLEDAVASCDGNINFKQICDYFQTHDNSSNRSKEAIKNRYYQLYPADQKNLYSWTEEDKELLLKATEEKHKNWKKATEYYNDNKKDSQPHRTLRALRTKFDALYSSKSNYIKYRLSWTGAEDKLLEDAVASCDGNINFKKIYDYFQTHNNSSVRSNSAINNRYQLLYSDDQNDRYDIWTEEDKELLQKAIEVKNKNWEEIEKYYNDNKKDFQPYRTENALRKEFYAPSDQTISWTNEDKELLLKAREEKDNWKEITKYYNDNKKDFRPYRTEQALRGKFDALYPSDQKNPYDFWTEDEKELLLKAREEKDKNWKKITEYYNNNKKHSQPHRTKKALKKKLYVLYQSSKNLAKEEQTIKVEDQNDATSLTSQKDDLLE